ncbi:MAG: hypothetical protein AB1942_03440 [Pseudomonadota bacterium]
MSLRTRLILAALILGLAAPVCGLAQPTPQPVSSDTRSWKSLGDLLKAADPVFRDAAVRNAARAAVPDERLLRDLRWTREPGLLIHVRMQAPTTGQGSVVPLGTPVVLGVGDTPLSAAFAGFSDPPLQPAPAAGMREATERSFLVWAALGRRGRLSFSLLAPLEAQGLRRAAERLIADPKEAPEEARRRALRILTGFQQEMVARGASADVLERLQAAVEAHRSAYSSLANQTQRRVAAVQAERGDNRALQLVEAYSNVLTLEGLRLQARPWVEARDVRRKLAAARTPAAIRQVLIEHRDENRRRISATDLEALRRTERDRYRAVLEVAASQPEGRAALGVLLPPRP